MPGCRVVDEARTISLPVLEAASNNRQKIPLDLNDRLVTRSGRGSLYVLCVENTGYGWKDKCGGIMCGALSRLPGAGLRMTSLGAGRGLARGRLSSASRRIYLKRE